MNDPGFADVLEPALAQALEHRGFTALTPVQRAVLDPATAGRDLRISPQTGSGKTVAIGLALHEIVAPRRAGGAAGRAGGAGGRAGGAVAVLPGRAGGAVA